MEDLCLKIQQNIRLEFLGWEESLGRMTVDISPRDMDKIYEVIQAFVDKGYPVTIEDQTQITFPAKSSVSLFTHQQLLFLETMTTILHNLTYGHKELDETIRKQWSKIPLDIESFWTLPLKQEIAACFRAHMSRQQHHNNIPLAYCKLIMYRSEIASSLKPDLPKTAMEILLQQIAKDNQ